MPCQLLPIERAARKQKKQTSKKPGSDDDEDEDEEEEDDDDDEEDEKDDLKEDEEEEEDTVQANFDETETFKLPAAADRAKEGESNFIMLANYRNSQLLFDLDVYFNPPSLVYIGLLQMDLQTIHQRIRDNVDVLSHFSEKREEGKERSEYLSLLRSDLCTYYSYNEFLISKLMDIFPVSEVCVSIC